MYSERKKCIVIKMKGREENASHTPIFTSQALSFVYIWYVRIFPTVFMYLGLHGNKAPVFFLYHYHRL